MSWLSSVEIYKNRRERVLVSLSGVAPDLDGIGLIADKITGTTHYYFEYHHHVGHNLLAAFLLGVLTWCLSTHQRILAAVGAFLVAHLHIFCDMVGSKDPSGYDWPIYYLFPLNKEFTLTWSGQWELNAWPNQVVLLAALAMSAYYASTKQVTFFEVFSRRLDMAALKMYHKLLGARA